MSISGNKADTKVYRHHTLYPGGLKEIPFETVMERHPERIVEQAVRRMMPKTKMGRKMVKKLHVYAGPEHPHAAQKPESVSL